MVRDEVAKFAKKNYDNINTPLGIFLLKYIDQYSRLSLFANWLFMQKFVFNLNPLKGLYNSLDKKDFLDVITWNN